MCDNHEAKRRTFLRGAAATAGVAALGPAAAASDGRSGGVTVLENGSDVKRWKLVGDGRTVFYRRRKGSGRIQYATVEGASATESEVGSYEDLVERWNAFTENIGSCPSVYSDHAYAGVSVELTENFGDLRVVELAGALYDLLPIPEDGIAGVDLRGIVEDLAGFIIDNFEGATATAGVYDRQGGWTIPEAAIGATDTYDAGYDDLEIAQVVGGAHVSPAVL